MRRRFIYVAVTLLEPKPGGRPRGEPSEAERVRGALEGENREPRIELEAARIREELAITLPHVLKPSKGPQEKRRGKACRVSAVCRRARPHARRLQCAWKAVTRPSGGRRGVEKQADRRRTEREVRKRVTAFRKRVKLHGIPLAETARRICVCPTLVSQWER